MKTSIRLETKRLVIRDHRPEDLASMHRLLSDSAGMYYLPDLKTDSLARSQEKLDAAICEIGRAGRSRYFFCIESVESGRYVGEIGFTVRLDTPEGKTVDLGFFIVPEFWGSGIATEAAREVMRFAFESLDVVKVEAGCIKDNKASLRVMQKTGMIKEADYRKRVWHDGLLRDRVEYGLLREEWEAGRKGGST